MSSSSKPTSSSSSSYDLIGIVHRDGKKRPAPLSSDMLAAAREAMRHDNATEVRKRVKITLDQFTDAQSAFKEAMYLDAEERLKKHIVFRNQNDTFDATTSNKIKQCFMKLMQHTDDHTLHEVYSYPSHHLYFIAVMLSVIEPMEEEDCVVDDHQERKTPTSPNYSPHSPEYVPTSPTDSADDDDEHIEYGTCFTPKCQSYCRSYSCLHCEFHHPINKSSKKPIKCTASCDYYNKNDSV